MDRLRSTQPSWCGSAEATKLSKSGFAQTLSQHECACSWSPCPDDFAWDVHVHHMVFHIFGDECESITCNTCISHVQNIVAVGASIKCRRLPTLSFQGVALRMRLVPCVTSVALVPSRMVQALFRVDRGRNLRKKIKKSRRCHDSLPRSCRNAPSAWQRLCHGKRNWQMPLEHCVSSKSYIKLI